MRKIHTILASILLTVIGVTACADDRPIKVNQLPEAARTFIKEFFPEEKVALASEDKDAFGKTYEVTFTSGTRIEFTGKGEWKEVDCVMSPVPAGIVPEPIAAKVAELYEGVAIISIDRDKHDYEVGLSNRLDLKFDLQYNLIEIDD